MQIAILVGDAETPGGSSDERVLRVEESPERPEAVLAVVRAIESSAFSLEEVTRVRCVGSGALTGIALDAWQTLGGDVTRTTWVHGGGRAYDAASALLGLPVDPAARRAARDFAPRRVDTIRVDAPGWPRSAHAFIVGLGAAASMLGEANAEGVSLVGLLRGAGQALGALGEDPETTTEIRCAGEVLAREARLVVATGLGLPPAIARWSGGLVDAHADPRLWFAEVDLGNLRAMLRGGPLRSVALGQVTVRPAGVLTLDGARCELPHQPVRIARGPTVSVLVPVPGKP